MTKDEERHDARVAKRVLSDARYQCANERANFCQGPFERRADGRVCKHGRIMWRRRESGEIYGVCSFDETHTFEWFEGPTMEEKLFLMGEIDECLHHTVPKEKIERLRRERAERERPQTLEEAQTKMNHLFLVHKSALNRGDTEEAMGYLVELQNLGLLWRKETISHPFILQAIEAGSLTMGACFFYHERAKLAKGSN